MSAEEFRERYRITARQSGVVYDRRKLISYIVADLRRDEFYFWTADTRRAFAASCIDEHRWMMMRTGFTPTAVARDIYDEAVSFVWPSPPCFR